MTDNAQLTKRREELKFALQEDHNKTLVDVMLDWVNYPFRKIVGNNRMFSFIFGTLSIYLLTMLFGIIIVVLVGEFYIVNELAVRFSWWFYLSFATAPLSATVANLFIHRIIFVFRNDIVPIVETIETLDEIEKWIKLACNKKLALASGLVGSVVAGSAVLLNLAANLGFNVGFGFGATFILFSIQSSLFVYSLYLILLLTVGMRRYELMLFPFDPSNSQVINTLSGLMSSFVYLFALYGAGLTYGILYLGLLSSFTQILPMFWGLIVLIFAANQYSLAKIIQRVKWKTLNDLQKQIQAIQFNQPDTDKSARETLDWLYGHYNRIKAARNSALNLEAGLNLLNSLLLPLLAFVLGNLDKIIALIH